MADDFFANTVIYVARHDEDGAQGIVINRPSNLQIRELLNDLEIDADNVQPHAVLQGGPLRPEAGFVLHTPVGSWQSSLLVTDDIALTTSKDVLSAVSTGEGPKQLLVSLGYSGWSAGQLEEEIAQNAWLTVPASAHILFDMSPAERYHAAMTSLGINPSLLSGDIGHA